MDEKQIETVAQIAKEVAKDAYTDVGKPILKPAGELIGLIPRTIKAALLPLEKWICQREYNLEETQKLLEEKLKKVSPDLIVQPEPHIAVPALQYISYCMDNKELREMYANLLANSMNKIVRNGVHPSFIEIIRQLCPDEAKVLKIMARLSNIPTISVEYHSKKGGKRPVYKNFSTIGKQAGCENPLDIRKYFNNLYRLGLIETEKNVSIFDKSVYDPLTEHPFIISLKKPEEYESLGYNSVRIVNGYFALSVYGESFCSIVFKDE